MDIRQVTALFSVAPQIDSSDLDAIKQQGFNSIICNRPDGESENQPGFSEIQQKAEQLGIRCMHLPVISGKITDDNVRQFDKVIASLTPPTLGYCRTGTRSITLWALSNPGKLSRDQRVKLAKEAGYPLDGVI